MNKNNKYWILTCFIGIVIIYSLCMYLMVKNLEIPTRNSLTIIQPNIQNFYKTIDVQITDIQTVWADNRIKKYKILVWNEEYNLEQTFYISNWDRYGYELESGQLNKKDIIKAELLSKVLEDKVISRNIEQLGY